MKLKTSPFEAANKLAGFGLQPFPAKIGERSPYVRWRDVPPPDEGQLREWYADLSESSYWIKCGAASGIIVLDIDNAEAERFWREVVGIGPLMDATVCVKTARGHHYYFALPEGQNPPGWAIHDGTLSFDVRGDGGGVIAPPSTHETGVVYTWIRAPKKTANRGMIEAPEVVMSRDAIQQHLPKGGGADSPKGKSLLSRLLSNPVPEGGRNDWLTKVAGHYAKLHRNMYDLYLVHLRLANGLLSDPLDDAEFTKVAESIWETEHDQHPERRATRATGYLLGAGDSIDTLVRIGKGDKTELGLQPWADFDLRVSGVVAEVGATEGDAVFDCILTRQHDGAEFPVILPGTLVGSARDLTKWLAGHQCSIARPDDAWPSSPPDNVRLLRYLTSQGAPRSRMVPSLGWDEESEGFLTNDGIIREDGPHPFEKVRPDPMLTRHGRISHSYGFKGGEEEARSVLLEVLSFHDPEVVAIFGAWWAACLLKPQIQQLTSLFPICAIEAPSGSGKTNGFFNLMIQLNGNTQGATQVTLAAGRDKMAAHKSGIVWVDDMDSLARIEELLRAVTSNETVIKKAFDNTGNVNIPLVAPVVVSGEQLGLSEQKALIDRVVILRPGRPDNRVSAKGDYPQWEDITTLTRAYPLTNGGLSTVSGTLVQMALREAPKVLGRLSAARRDLKKRSGRQAEKLAILTSGAYLLDRLVDPSLSDGMAGDAEILVSKWAETEAAVNGSAGEWDNRVTTTILPWALREASWPEGPVGHPAAWIERQDTLEGAIVWVSSAALADAWADHQRGRIEQRTDTQSAIAQQIKRCQDEHALNSKVWDVSPGRRERKQARYLALRAEVADVVIKRSQGW